MPFAVLPHRPEYTPPEEIPCIVQVQATAHATYHNTESLFDNVRSLEIM
jgi:hypothetical protein